MTDDTAPEPPHYVPTWERITLRCEPCGYSWQDWQPAQVPAKTWVAHIRAIGRCMRCGNKRQVFLAGGDAMTVWRCPNCGARWVGETECLACLAKGGR